MRIPDTCGECIYYVSDREMERRWRRFNETLSERRCRDWSPDPESGACRRHPPIPSHTVNGYSRARYLDVMSWFPGCGEGGEV